MISADQRGNERLRSLPVSIGTDLPELSFFVKIAAVKPATCGKEVSNVLACESIEHCFTLRNAIAGNGVCFRRLQASREITNRSQRPRSFGQQQGIFFGLCWPKTRAGSQYDIWDFIT